MADYVSREVARDRLRKACKLGKIVSVLLLLAGLAFGGIAAVVGLEVSLPSFVETAIGYIEPRLAGVKPGSTDMLAAIAEVGAQALLFFLIGLVGILMFRKIGKTSDAFRMGQLRQLKFEMFLLTLLGFIPTIAANVTRAVIAFQQGTSLLAGIDLHVDVMCVIAGIFAYVAVRPLLAGVLLGTEEEELELIDPTAASPEPNYSDVPDLAHVPTAVPEVDNTIAAPTGNRPTFVKDPAWDSVEAEFENLDGSSNDL